MWGLQIVLAVIGLSAGITVAGGLFSFISGLGVISDFADRTHTGAVSYTHLPEEQVIENPKIKVQGIEDEALKNKWEYYVNQVYEMDAFAGKLVQAIEDRGEPTVIVFYGDHLPTMGLKAEDLKSRYLYNTDVYKRQGCRRCL